VSGEKCQGKVGIDANLDAWRGGLSCPRGNLTAQVFRGRRFAPEPFERRTAASVIVGLRASSDPTVS
jgi:hypothetical protein